MVSRPGHDEWYRVNTLLNPVRSLGCRSCCLNGSACARSPACRGGSVTKSQLLIAVLRVHASHSCEANICFCDGDDDVDNEHLLIVS